MSEHSDEQQEQPVQGDQTGGEVSEGAGLNAEDEQTEAERQQTENDEE